MAKYQVKVSESAYKELLLHKKAGNKSDLRKIASIFKELELHPYEGIGKPELLKYSLKGFWSRRINKKDRIIYKIEDEKVLVYVVSAKGHYFDK